MAGKANAINLSGSLRMLSFRTLSEVQQPGKRLQALDTIEAAYPACSGYAKTLAAMARQFQFEAMLVQLQRELDEDHAR